MKKEEIKLGKISNCRYLKGRKCLNKYRQKETKRKLCPFDLKQEDTACIDMRERYGVSSKFWRKFWRK